MSRVVSDHHTGHTAVSSGLWLEMLLNVLQCIGQIPTPHNKNYLVQSVKSAEAENSGTDGSERRSRGKRLGAKTAYRLI